MALLLFIRSFPVRAVVFLEHEFPKSGFELDSEVGKQKADIRNEKD
jgi:hypothetical protein